MTYDFCADRLQPIYVSHEWIPWRLSSGLCRGWCHVNWACWISISSLIVWSWTRSETTQHKDKKSKGSPLSSQTISNTSLLAMAFVPDFAPNSLYHNARHVNQISGTEHSSPKEIMCHQRMEELANPSLLLLLLLRAWGVAYLLLSD